MAARIVRVEKDMFVLVDDMLLLLKRAVLDHYLRKMKKVIRTGQRMEILERISTRIQLSVMKGVLQNWVVGQWKYLFSFIFLATR